MEPFSWGTLFSFRQFNLRILEILMALVLEFEFTYYV